MTLEQDKFCDNNCVWTDHHPDCKLSQQEPEWYHVVDVHGCNRFYHKTEYCPYEFRTPLYTTPPQRPSRSDIKPLTDWIDPNDKTQERFLPNIGEPVLFCHEGKTYYGKHNGGSFQCGYGVTKRHYNTWECRWIYLPAAHGIIKE